MSWDVERIRSTYEEIRDHLQERYGWSIQSLLVKVSSDSNGNRVDLFAGERRVLRYTLSGVAQRDLQVICGTVDGIHAWSPSVMMLSDVVFFEVESEQEMRALTHLLCVTFCEWAEVTLLLDEEMQKLPAAFKDTWHFMFLDTHFVHEGRLYWKGDDPASPCAW